MAKRPTNQFNKNRSSKEFRKQLAKSDKVEFSKLRTACTKFELLESVRKSFCFVLNVMVCVAAKQIMLQDDSNNNQSTSTDDIKLLAQIEPNLINRHLDISNLWKFIQMHELKDHEVFKTTQAYGNTNKKTT